MCWALQVSEGLRKKATVKKVKGVLNCLYSWPCVSSSDLTLSLNLVFLFQSISRSVMILSRHYPVFPGILWTPWSTLTVPPFSGCLYSTHFMSQCIFSTFFGRSYSISSCSLSPLSAALPHAFLLLTWTLTILSS